MFSRLSWKYFLAGRLAGGTSPVGEQPWWATRRIHSVIRSFRANGINLILHKNPVAAADPSSENAGVGCGRDRQSQTAVSQIKVPTIHETGSDQGAPVSKSITSSVGLPASEWNESLPAAVGHSPQPRKSSEIPHDSQAMIPLSWRRAAKWPSFSRHLASGPRHLGDRKARWRPGEGLGKMPSSGRVLAARCGDAGWPEGDRVGSRYPLAILLAQTKSSGSESGILPYLALRPSRPVAGMVHFRLFLGNKDKS